MSATTGISSGDHPSAVVVGAGVFGASAARALSLRGWQVTLVERYAPANARSSSGDATRLLRFGHVDHPDTGEWYTRSAWRALPLWKELGEEDGRPLFVETGMVWFVSGDGHAEARARDLIRDAGATAEWVSPSELTALFPDVRVDDLTHGLLEPQAGVVRASDGVRALVRSAQRHGTRVRHGTARPQGQAVLVEGERLEADRVIWACGAWLGRLFPQSVPIVATRQMMFYWDVGSEWHQAPAWIDPAARVYGHADLDGLGFKAAPDIVGPEVDPDGPRSPDAGAQEVTEEFIARRFPALAQVPVLRAFPMHYELAPGRDFVIGPLPGDERVWIMGGGSGHGFKHGPALGAYVADVLESKAPLERRLAPSGHEP